MTSRLIQILLVDRHHVPGEERKRLSAKPEHALKSPDSVQVANSMLTSAAVT